MVNRIGSAVGATLGLSAAIGAVGIVDPEPAGAQGVSTITHNICGNVCSATGTGNTGALQDLKTIIVSGGDLPAHIGLNEACGALTNTATQLGSMKNFLRNRSEYYYGGQHVQYIYSGLCNSSGSQYFGVGVYALSTDNPNDRGGVVSGAFDAQLVTDAEARGYVCINGGIGSPKYWACSAHMNHTNPGSSVTGAIAEEQFAEYYGEIIRPKTNKIVYWGGDMYVFVSEMPNIPITGGNFSFSNNQEADLCQSGTNTYRWTHRNKFNGDQAKYDYAFRSGPGQQACPTDAALHPANPSDMFDVGTFTSDHRIVMGYQEA